jgi:hypothetical protein
MIQAPNVDERTAREISADVRELLSSVRWPEDEQKGAFDSALIHVFARFSELIIHRLNQAPGKEFPGVSRPAGSFAVAHAGSAGADHFLDRGRKYKLRAGAGRNTDCGRAERRREEAGDFRNRAGTGSDSREIGFAFGQVRLAVIDTKISGRFCFCLPVRTVRQTPLRCRPRMLY